MAKLFLAPNDSITISDGMQVFGAAGEPETLKVDSHVTALKANANIDRIEFVGVSTSYKFESAGTNVYIWSGTTKVADIGVQTDADGTVLAFSDGSAHLINFGFTNKLGGVTVPTAAGGGVITPPVDTTDKSTVTSTPVATTEATDTIAKNAATGTVAYSATATAVDAGDTRTFSLGDPDAALFNIDPAPRAVTFKSSADFETKSGPDIFTHTAMIDIVGAPDSLTTLAQSHFMSAPSSDSDLLAGDASGNTLNGLLAILGG